MHPWSTGSASQPNGVTLFPWSEGKQHVVWDYTCHDTVCQSYVGGTSKEAGKAAEEAELAKNEHNDVAAKFVVVPIAKETFGSWGTLSLHFIRQIGARIAARTGNKRATYDLQAEYPFFAQGRPKMELKAFYFDHLSYIFT